MVSGIQQSATEIGFEMICVEIDITDCSSGCEPEAVLVDERGTTCGEADHELSALAEDTHRP